MSLHHPNVVEFDPSNVEHRKAAREFLKRECWGDTNFRFIPPTWGNTGQMVKEKLLAWYVSQDVM